MRKNIAAVTVAAASILGLGAGFAFGSPNLVGAQTATDTSSTTTAPVAVETPAPAPAPAKVDFVKTALNKLVAAGTITQAQADAVAKAITDARPARGAGDPGMGKPGKGDMGGRGGFGIAGGMGVVDAAAKALNMTSDELIKQVTSGTTVAKIAESKGVALNTVVDAVVKELSTKLDAAVTAGKMTQVDADAKKATLTKMVTDFANGTIPMPGFGKGMPGMPGMPGMRGGHGGAPGAAPATPTTTATPAGS